VPSFVDRVRTLGRKITPTSDDPAVLKTCSDQSNRLVLASFTKCLGGNPGKHARYNLPTSIEDSIRVAVTVEQAEACHPKSDAFYLEERRMKFGTEKGIVEPKPEIRSGDRTHLGKLGKRVTQRSVSWVVLTETPRVILVGVEATIRGSVQHE
jgi:hypothetical protein